MIFVGAGALLWRAVDHALSTGTDVGLVVHPTDERVPEEFRDLHTAIATDINDLDGLFAEVATAGDVVWSTGNPFIFRSPILDLGLTILNVHGGPLPEYRGLPMASAAYAILNGEKRFGVTVHRVDAGIDTGEIVAQRMFDLTPDITLGELTLDVTQRCHDIFVASFDGLRAGTLTPALADPAPGAARPAGSYYGRKELARIGAYRDRESFARATDLGVLAERYWFYSLLFGLAARGRADLTEEIADLRYWGQLGRSTRPPVPIPADPGADTSEDGAAVRPLGPQAVTALDVLGTGGSARLAVFAAATGMAVRELTGDAAVPLVIPADGPAGIVPLRIAVPEAAAADAGYLQEVHERIDDATAHAAVRLTDVYSALAGDLDTTVEPGEFVMVSMADGPAGTKHPAPGIEVGIETGDAVVTVGCTRDRTRYSARTAQRLLDGIEASLQRLAQAIGSGDPARGMDAEIGAGITAARPADRAASGAAPVDLLAVTDAESGLNPADLWRWIHELDVGQVPVRTVVEAFVRCATAFGYARDAPVGDADVRALIHVVRDLTQAGEVDSVAAGTAHLVVVDDGTHDRTPEFHVLATGDVDPSALDVFVAAVAKAAVAIAAGDRVVLTVPDTADLLADRTTRAWPDRTGTTGLFPHLAGGGTGPAAELCSGSVLVARADGRTGLDTDGVVAQAMTWLASEIGDLVPGGVIVDVERDVRDEVTAAVPGRLSVRYPVLLDPDRIAGIPPGVDAVQGMRDAGVVLPDRSSVAGLGLLLWRGERPDGVVQPRSPARVLIRVADTSSELVAGVDMPDGWGPYGILITVLCRPAAGGARRRRARVLVQSRCGRELDAIALAGALAARSATPRPDGWDLDAVVDDVVHVHAEQKPLVHLSATDRQELTERFGETADVLPLSPLQEGLFYHLQLANETGTTDLYAVQSRIRITGALDSGRMKTAVAMLLARTPNLSAGFVRIGGQALQVIPPDPAPPVRTVRRSEWSGDDPDKILAEERSAPFVADRPPLIRFLLLEISDGEWIVAMTREHLLFDGWSLGHVWNDLLALYSDPSGASVPARTAYRDYLEWLAEREGTASGDAWRRYLAQSPGDAGAGGPEPTIVAPAAADVAADAAAAADVYRYLDATLQRKVVDACRDAGVTVGTFFQVAWGITLARMTNRLDAVFGTSVSGRPPELAGAESIIGLLYNTVPVAVSAPPTASVRDVLVGQHSRSAGVIDAAHVPLSEIHRIAGCEQLFDTLFIIQNQPVVVGEVEDRGEPGGSRIELADFEVDDSTHYPLSFAVLPDDRIRVRCSYRGDLYSESDIGTIIDRLIGTLAAMSADVEAPVGRIGVTVPAERSRYAGWNDTTRELPALTIGDLLQRQAERTPGETAIVAGDTRLTFAELLDSARRCAALLRERGVTAEDRVGLLLPRDERTVVSLFGVFFAGGAYVPIDADHPAERIEYILDAADPAAIVTTSALLDRLPGRRRIGAVVLDADDVETRIAALDVAPAPASVHVDNLAYVIFTSGSTGRPKGVAVGHRGLTNMYFNHVRKIFDPVVAHQGGRRMRIAHTTSFSFDASWEQLFWLLDGHEVHVIDDDLRKDPQRLLEHYDRELIDGFDVTPSYGQVLVEEGLLERPRPTGRSTSESDPGVVFVSLGGEAVPDALWTALREAPGVESYNLYGPTEYTINALGADLADGETSNAGRPIDNTRAYVLDVNLQPVPTGTAGELYLAGVGVARGYLGRPALTAERFVADPFDRGERLYRTGDQVRWRSDGQIDFLGRTDDQIKIRGFRVELNEIAETVRAHPDVTAATVTVIRDDDAAVTRLAAYYTAVRSIPVADLRDFVAARLPGYMVPAGFAELATLPLTTNGKIDHAALPAPDLTSTGAVVAPASGVERDVRSVVASVVGVEEATISVDSAFIDIGVDSLRLARLTSRLNAQLDVTLTLRSLIENPTIAGIAHVVDEVRGHGETARMRVADVVRPTGPIPASHGQQSLWLIDQLSGPSDQYIVPYVLPLVGDVDVAALGHAVGDVVGRHEALRTLLIADDVVGLRQEILPASDAAEKLSVQIVDGREWDAQQVGRHLRSSIRRPFTLGADLPIRVVLVRRADGCVLGVAVHHSAFDEWSTPAMYQDLASAYAARSEGRTPAWSPLPVQYAEYAIWQQRYLGDQSDEKSLLEQQLSYWRGALDGAPEVSGVPAVRPRPVVPTWSGAWREDIVADATVSRLREVARRHDVSMFMLTQAAVALAVWSLGSGDDVVIGSPVGGRTDSDLDDLVGYFVNTLPLRYDLSGRPTLAEVLARVRAVILAGFENQEAPFEAIVRAAGVERSTSHTPLFQMMLIYREDGGPPGDFAPGVGVGAVDRVAPETVKCDVELYVTVGTDRITAFGGYAAELYDTDTVECFVQTLSRVLDAFAADSSVPVAELDLVAAQDRELIAEWSRGPRTPRAAEATVDGLLRAQAAATPSANAVVFGDATLSYAAFDARVDRLALELIRQGIRVGDVVGVVLQRSEWLPVALAAVVRAGAAYVPVDPSYPPDRVGFLLGDSAPAGVVTDQPTSCGGLSSLLAAIPIRIIVDAPAAEEALAGGPVEPVTDALRSRLLSPGDTVALIYTSGTTGEPKGVELSHAGLVNRIRWAVQRFGSGGVGLAKSAIGFVDASTEIFAMLARGGTLVVADTEAVQDAERIAALVRRHRVTDLVTVPGLADALIETGDAHAQLSGLRRWICSGERLTARTADALRRLVPEAEIVNLYGSTEVTGDATAFTAAPERAADPDGVRVPIGAPVPNTDALVLDRNLRPVAPGVTGELYLRGVQVASGYRNRPALTAERFVATPAISGAASAGERLYRTGDIVRWGRDGLLDYVGRSDDQVKIRGHRIELGEISSTLAAASGVGAATAVLDENDGLTRVVGYVAPAGGVPVDDLEGARIREQAARFLPAPMVPAAVIVVDALPRTANGKVDRAALPRPEFGSPVTAQTLPTTPTEKILCEIFADILGLESVGTEDDFFLLGGHSLLAISLSNRIRSSSGVAVPLRGIFDTPTVAQIAELIDSGSTAAGQPPLVRLAEPPARLPLSFAQQRMWVLHQIQGPTPTYNVPMFWKAPSGRVDIAVLRAAISDVARRHCTLRTIFPSVNGSGIQDVQAPDVSVPVELKRIGRGDLAAGVTEALRHAFDLESEIPLRVDAFEFDGDHLVVLVIHHIATDEWSARRLRTDLDTAYVARLAGRSPSYVPLPVEYTDYTVWERDRIGDRDDPNSVAARQLGYWRTRLEGAPQELPLPLDRPRPAQISHRGSTVPVVCEREHALALRAVAEQHRISMFMLVHAAVAITLCRSGSGDDIVLGTPISGRTDQQLEDLVGFFLNTVVLRTDLSGDPSISDVLARVREDDLAAFDHQDIPFEHVVDAVGPSRTMSMHPLFQVMVVYIGAVDAPPPVAGRRSDGTLRGLANSSGTAKFDLSFDFTENEAGGFSGVVEYSTDLFDERTVEALADRFHRVLEAMTSRVDQRIGSIEVLGEERAIVALPPAMPSLEEAVPDTIAELFLEAVHRHPHATAVVSGSTEWTFADLAARSRRVAARLQSRGVGPEDVVVVCLPRGAGYVAAIFGVLIAGAAYLPIDPATPSSRVRSMAADAHAAMSIIDDSTRAIVPGDLPFLRLHEAYEDGDPGWIGVRRHPDHPVYILFTSGTTGRPKGVAVTNRGLVNLYASHRKALHDTVVASTGRRHLRVGHAWSFAFDASWQPLLWIFGGHTVDIVDEDTQRDPDALLARLNGRRWDFLELTPTYIEQLLDRGLGSDIPIAMLGFGGEAVSANLWSRLRNLPDTVAVNLYGPTESTVDAAVAAATDSDRPVIGRPVGGTTAYILDDLLRPVPIGVEGEMYLAGAGLARGYIGRAGLTAERFVADPIGGSRMYRTGDRARWTFDGLIEYRGRSDDQVKLRGFRIELGEIESTLKAMAGVSDAAVVVREIAGGAPQLVGYVAADRDIDVRAEAARTLPDYMVPSAVVTLDTLPLLASGKIDRAALPAPIPLPRGVGPSTALERTLCEIVADVVGVATVAADADFFELGGDSIVAMKLVGEARAHGLRIAPRDVFTHRSVIELAGTVEYITEQQGLRHTE
ncbi:amino acid adenylation domain-containing protein [Tsukamurella sp. 8F]|uniref:non-ribosomal peptide synthetase n=1 Tax=unclassified Tsukamurella TaxID=2633480 RepID=UPI0023B8B192|nr:MULTISPECIES: non-ribosomal peptide synthetase [unclassified Tsukamurella]MDF0531166.1 amino acid adenylation domain-containing protein [Tsukamurella sp. 8J]MDF0585887.1 amino acid adenylation domain-containing protein [Tsukamurella sp. 8F]